MNPVLLCGLIAGIGIIAAVALTIYRRMYEDVTSEVDSPTRLPGAERQRGDRPEYSLAKDILAESISSAPEDSLDWLALAADELRTPITSLRDQAEYLRHHLANAPQGALIPVAERLVEQLASLEGLVGAWSASAANAGAGHEAARPIDLHALAHSLCAQLTKLHEPPYDLAAGPPVWALVDVGAIEHALVVLLRSARRAAPDGLIEVVARVAGDASGRRICVSVADRRSSSRRHSMDLWEDLELDLVRVLIEDCGGLVELGERGGGGAVTTLWLPGRLLIPMTGTLATATMPRLRRTA